MLRDPKVQRILLTVVVSGIVLWSYFFTNMLPFGYSRRSAELKQLHSDYDGASAELEKARQTVGRLPQLERESAELDRKWEQAQTLLPTDKEMADLLTQITQAGQQSGVEFELFRPEAQKPQEFYNENAVSIEVSTGFHQLGMFLSRLANLSRIVNVTQIKMASVGGKKEDKEDASVHTLKASFLATAYSLRDPSAASTATTAAEAEPASRGASRERAKVASPVQRARNAGVEEN